MKVILPDPSDENALEVIQIDPWDTWSMDYTLAKIIVPMLNQLKRDGHGYPDGLESTEQWREVIDKMIWSFEQSFDQYGILLDERTEYHATAERIKEGFDLFGKYYMALWD